MFDPSIINSGRPPTPVILKKGMSGRERERIEGKEREKVEKKGSQRERENRRSFIMLKAIIMLHYF